MFKVLIADDDYEDRELLKLEIQQALRPEEADIRFREAGSVRDAVKLLDTQVFDLMTLDIEFDRMTEGVDILPELFDTYLGLNIIVISGKLDKAEVSERLFRFTKDNVLKGKRWARHFDVLDKKDDKAEAIRRAYSFARQQQEGADKVRDLFLLAESYLDRNMLDKCAEVYQKIQHLAPHDEESTENLRIIRGELSVEQAWEYYRVGERVVAALLLGHYLERRLKAYTAEKLGRTTAVLLDGLRMMQQEGRITRARADLFSELMGLRNKAVHQPTALSDGDFQTASRKLELLEEPA